MIPLDCTPEELKELHAVLGQCSCDGAWEDRGLDSHCMFCGCAFGVLLLIRQRDFLRARGDVLAKGYDGLLKNNDGLLKLCKELQAERDHLSKLVDCVQYFQEHVPEEGKP